MKTLSDYMDADMTKLYNTTGAFYAFGQKQFNATKKEGVLYVSLGGGLICPKDKVTYLTTGLDAIWDRSLALMLKENTAEDIISHEYFNHETQLTSDYSAALEALEAFIQASPETFTPELINATFKKCFALAVKNNWF